MSELTDWATVRCEKHDMVSCGDCLEQKRMRRDGADLRYRDDCGVATFAEITGVEYDFAAEVLREAGATLGSGTAVKTLVKAFADVGLKATELPGTTLDEALRESRTGRLFYVCGFTRNRYPQGHAWTIIDGKTNRDYLRNKRIIYRVYEVTA